MPNALASLAAGSATQALQQSSSPTTPDFRGAAAEGSESARDAFQRFVAGTFYGQMFKSLRSMHEEPAYFHGGQAERIFQQQMDQQVAEDLAKKQGAAFAEPLFQSFAARHLGTQLQAGTAAL